MTAMMADEAFAVLGLTPSAGPRSVKKAFRRLAKKHHPDLRHDPSARVDFVRVVEAYTTLQREFRQQSSGSDARLCPSCGRFEDLFDGLDGGVECAECMLGVSRRRLLLPSTTLRVVRHISVIVMEVIALCIFVYGLATDSYSALAVSVGLSVFALGLLAVVCVWVRNVK